MKDKKEEARFIASVKDEGKRKKEKGKKKREGERINDEG
jgi:hypothetical protein